MYALKPLTSTLALLVLAAFSPRPAAAFFVSQCPPRDSPEGTYALRLGQLTTAISEEGHGSDEPYMIILQFEAVFSLGTGGIYVSWEPRNKAAVEASFDAPLTVHPRELTVQVPEQMGSYDHSFVNFDRVQPVATGGPPGVKVFGALLLAMEHDESSFEEVRTMVEDVAFPLLRQFLLDNVGSSLGINPATGASCNNPGVGNCQSLLTAFIAGGFGNNLAAAAQALFLANAADLMWPIADYFLSAQLDPDDLIGFNVFADVMFDNYTLQTPQSITQPAPLVFKDGPYSGESRYLIDVFVNFEQEAVGDQGVSNRAFLADPGLVTNSPAAFFLSREPAGLGVRSKFVSGSCWDADEQVVSIDTGADARPTVVVDMNLDERSDLALFTFDSSLIIHSLVRNDNNSTPWDLISQPLREKEATDAAQTRATTADFDGDGRQDIVVTWLEDFGYYALILFSNGDGTWTEGRRFGDFLPFDATEVPEPAPLALGAGRPQAFVIRGYDFANQRVTVATLIPREAQGSTRPCHSGARADCYFTMVVEHVPMSPSIAVLEPHRFSTGDVDRDGAGDLIFAGAPTGDGVVIQTLFGNEGGTWTAGPQVATGQPAHALTGEFLVMDLEGNGTSDLVLTHYPTPERVRLITLLSAQLTAPALRCSPVTRSSCAWHATGNGPNHQPLELPFPPQPGLAHTLGGDLDADGRDDLLFVGTGWKAPGLHLHVKKMGSNYGDWN